MVAVPGIDELNGFVVFAPGLQEPGEVALYFTRTVLRLSLQAVALLECPDYVNVFLDYNAKRIMLKPAKKEDANALALQTMPKSKIKQKRYILCDSLKREINAIGGKEIYKGGNSIPGHKADVKSPVLIFSFRDLRENGRLKAQEKS